MTKAQIIREARGDEYALTDAFDSITASGSGVITARSSKRIIGPVGASVECVSGASAGLAYGVFNAVPADTLTELYAAAYFSVATLHAVGVVTIISMRHGADAAVGSVQVTTTGALMLQQSGASSVTSDFLLTLDKTFLVELYATISDSASNMSLWAADRNSQPQLLASSTGNVTSSTLFGARIGIAAKSSSTQIFAANVAAPCISTARRGHLQILRGRDNIVLPNSKETWLPINRRVRDSGLVCV